MRVGTDIKIVGKAPTRSLFPNDVSPLSYVEPYSPVIRFCADGWKRMIQLECFDPSRFFVERRGVAAVSFAITHESIHQILYEIEGVQASLKLDHVSGGGELV